MAAQNNTLDLLIQKILARGLTVLRKKVLMTRLVNTDFKNEAKEYGTTIDIPYSTAKTVKTITPSHIPTAPTDQTTRFAQITIDQWKGSDFGMNDNEMRHINANDFWVPDQVVQSMDTIAVALNASIFSKYTGVYGTYGTAGTTPFGSSVEGLSATGIRKVLNKQLCPAEGRSSVMDYDAEANALGITAFNSAETTGDNGAVKIKGEIGEKFGIMWNADSYVPTHTKGAGATTGVYLVDLTAGYTAEPTLRYSTVHIDTVDSNANALVAGDIITFAGQTQTYAVITSGVGATGADEGDIVISPGLQADLADGVAITKVDSHVVNLVFHKDAFGLAMRNPSMGLSEVDEVINSRTMADSRSGVILRLEKIRMYKQTMWDFDAIWGAGLVRPEFAARLLG